MSDKPLAEKWCEESKRCKQIADECGDDSVFAQSVRYWMCADELKKFAAEHLAPQSEPDSHDCLCANGFFPKGSVDNKLMADMLVGLRNAERRRIRELLVGNDEAADNKRRNK